MEALEAESPELADEIKKRMFVFEDLVMLDDRSIQRVLRDVDMKDLALALKTASAEVSGLIFKNMSKRASEMLKEDMNMMGPVRLRDRGRGPAEDRQCGAAVGGLRRDHHRPWRGGRDRCLTGLLKRNGFRSARCVG